MKKALLIIVICCFAVTAKAQFYVQPEAKVGMSGSSDIDNVTELYDDAGTSTFTYSAGVNFGYVIRAKFPVIVGLHYMRNRLSFGEQDIKGEQRSSNGMVTPYVSHHTIEIPVKAGYVLKIRSFKPFIEVGGVMGIPVAASYSNDLDNSSVDNETTVAFGLLGGLGTFYELSDRIDISASLSYKRYLSKLEWSYEPKPEKEFYYKPYFVSLNLGLVYKF